MTTALAWIPLALACLVLLHTGWWSLLALVALKRPALDVPSPGTPGGPLLRLTVVVPAYNEERMVAETVRSLLAAPYEPRPEVIVVADNCTDATAEQARAAGATVLCRTEATQRGKSHALNFAIEHIARRETEPDVVAFVDADTTVSPAFYAAVAASIAGGADAVQVHYAVAPGDAPLLRLRGLAFALIHWARPLGAARFGLGTSLKGNGMAFRWAVVSSGFAGAGITEDAAATLTLARRGIAVRFAPGATVWGHMAATYPEASVQDRRWEGGRFALLLPALGVCAACLLRGRAGAASSAMEVASLPLSVLVAAGVASFATAVLVDASFVMPAMALASVGLYCGLGWIAGRVSVRQLQALATAPRFLVFKCMVLVSVVLGRGPRSWQRTSRTGAR